MVRFIFIASAMLVLPIISSRHQGYAYLEHHGRYPWSYQG